MKTKIAMVAMLIFFFKFVTAAHAQLKEKPSQKTEPDSVNKDKEATAKDSPREDPWEKEDQESGRHIDYVHLREADVFWSKRIWRMIDLREKINLPLRYPEERLKDRKSLFHTIADGLTMGELHAYDALDDGFAIELPPSKVKEILVPKKLVVVSDLNDFEKVDSQYVDNPIQVSEISKFFIKEDWFFDKQRSVMDVRIVGIAPMKLKRDENGEARGDELLFWLYFPECRPVFARQLAFNRFNDRMKLTFDDVFAKRFFSSYIFKESNVYDRVINEYALGLNALLESERIKNKLFETEHDLWHY